MLLLLFIFLQEKSRLFRLVLRTIKQNTKGTTSRASVFLRASFASKVKFINSTRARATLAHGSCTRDAGVAEGRRRRRREIARAASLPRDEIYRVTHKSLGVALHRGRAKHGEPRKKTEARGWNGWGEFLVLSKAVATVVLDGKDHYFGAETK